MPVSRSPHSSRAAGRGARPGAAALFGACVLGATAACGERAAAPTAPSAEASFARGGGPPAAARPGGVPGHADEVRAIAAALDASWATKNAAAYAAHYAEDVAFVGAIGVPQVGRAAVQAAHVTLFGGPFAATTRRARVDRVTFLTGTAAVLESTVALSGFPPNTTAVLGGALALTCPAQGEVQTREIAVVEKRGRGWTIVRAYLVPVAANPPGPPAARPTCPLPVP